MKARFPFYLLADSVDGMTKEAAAERKAFSRRPVTNDIPTARSSPSGDSNPSSSHFAAMLWARGLGLQLASAKSAVVAPDNGLLSFGRQTWLGLTAWTWLMLLAFAVGAFALKYSAWARRVRAIGGNEESAQLLGVQTTGTKVSAYVLSGLAAGLAGIVLASQTGSVSTDTGKGRELIAIAAVVIGGTLLSGGIGIGTGHPGGPVADAVDLQRHRVREWPGHHLDQLVLGSVIRGAFLLIVALGPARVARRRRR